MFKLNPIFLNNFFKHNAVNRTWNFDDTVDFLTRMFNEFVIEKLKILEKQPNVKQILKSI